MNKKTPFDFVRAINMGTDIPVDNSYSQFLTNRAFSFYPETISVANEINMYGAVTDEMHFDFMRGMIPTKKRMVKKWPKPNSHADAKAIAMYFDIPMRHAYEYLELFSEDKLEEIKKVLEDE